MKFCSLLLVFWVLVPYPLEGGSFERESISLLVICGSKLPSPEPPPTFLFAPFPFLLAPFQAF